MDRRGFLGAILAAGVAPAIVRADSLMRIIPRDTQILPVLADYEAGIFTPTLTSALWPGIKAWYSKSYQMDARYVRTGNIVTITGTVHLNQD